jgi:hypothetical protein
MPADIAGNFLSSEDCYRDDRAPLLNRSVALTSSAQMPGSHAEWPASATMM